MGRTARPRVVFENLVSVQTNQRGDWMDVIINILLFALKPIAIYIAALTLVRIMGKRALGQLSLFDLVIMAGIGDVIVVVALERKVPFVEGLGILALLGGLELLFSTLTFRFHLFQLLLEGKPTLLIKDGVILQKNLAREHISRADLEQELRKLGVSRLSQVGTAVLEACGKFSVLTKEEEPSGGDVSNRQVVAELTALRRELQELKKMIAGEAEN